MGYWLGIDVGTTFTTAAICRERSGRHTLPEVVPLGNRSAAVSSVVYLGQDDQVVVGEAAERYAATNPDRVVREFTRRIGEACETAHSVLPEDGSMVMFSTPRQKFSVAFPPFQAALALIPPPVITVCDGFCPRPTTSV